MKYLLALLVLLFLTACSNESKESFTSVESNPEKITLPVKDAPHYLDQNAAAVVVETPTERSGEEIFTTICLTCHGINAGKKAMGRSEIIASWSEDKIVQALQGYKAGTYGKSMKGMMQNVLKNLDENEIKHVAEYISTQK